MTFKYLAGITRIATSFTAHGPVEEEQIYKEKNDKFGVGHVINTKEKFQKSTNQTDR